MIENHLTNEITCPYCGYEGMDSFEAANEGTKTCSDCTKEFAYVRNVEVTYTSYRKPEDCKHEDQTIYCDYCGKSI